MIPIGYRVFIMDKEFYKHDSYLVIGIYAEPKNDVLFYRLSDKFNKDFPLLMPEEGLSIDYYNTFMDKYICCL